eukprot:TRINITY_DN5092_c0_g2_i1.p2 TRINITY_DN5092_c0_g2~~TRINITY_DN5092_c0_g2_i1.p2  ORF type:complete len:268 (-),score=69.08 TRINITY_DN5092_c0_g2_i1:1885-2688(-)
MDFADGGDLGKCLVKQKASGTYLREEQVLEWFVQIALALKHIHSHNILHRDLKTQNIFLTAKGQVKVGDFGISRVLQNTDDLAETSIGTPYYLSPEICEKKPYSYKSDIWSLGCLLYEMLSFKRPFQASCIGSLVVSILAGKCKPLPAHWSKEVKALVVQMLAVDPDERPSVDQILEIPFIKKRALAMLEKYAEPDPLPTEESNIEPADTMQTKRMATSQERQSTSRLFKHKSITSAKAKDCFTSYSTRSRLPKVLLGELVVCGETG